jgi:hypothetical protein
MTQLLRGTTSHQFDLLLLVLAFSLGIQSKRKDSGEQQVSTFINSSGTTASQKNDRAPVSDAVHHVTQSTAVFLLQIEIASPCVHLSVDI